MDVETKLALIKGVGEEVITEGELRQLLETNPHPTAYDGFEPSGMAHLPFGVFRPLLLKDILKAGVRFKLLLADWFAWINNKMGGDLEKIQKVGEYFIEVWKAAGVETSKVEFVWSSGIMDKEYWKRVILIAKNTSVARATRCLTVMGRKAGELAETAQYFYPMMQCADVFHLGVDITQLGLDQRRANVLAREIAPRLGWKKPVVVSHHMLMGLQGVKEPEGYDVAAGRDVEISSKMSKSKPQTCIFVHDSTAEIKRKVGSAFCEAKNIVNNPMLDYSKHILFRAFKSMKIERAAKFGGPIEFGNYSDLESAFSSGQLHPLDLKNAVAEHLDRLIAPIREHFEKNRRANRLYEFVKSQEITR
ncbi:MAG: tyrosine--tRNA ligase [Candidatus Aenigmatarchaeota archaeon]